MNRSNLHVYTLILHCMILMLFLALLLDLISLLLSLQFSWVFCQMLDRMACVYRQWCVDI